MAKYLCEIEPPGLGRVSGHYIRMSPSVRPSGKQKNGYCDYQNHYTKLPDSRESLNSQDLFIFKLSGDIFRANNIKSKKRVINGPLGQPTVTTSSEDMFCFGRFWKVGTDGYTDGQHV